MVTEKMILRCGLVVFLMALIAYTFAMRYHRIEPSSLPSFEMIPSSISNYESVDERIDEDTERTLGADATLFRTYRSPGEKDIWLFIAFFATPQENSQIHSPRHCYPGAGWTIVSERKIPLPLEGNSHKVTILEIENGAEKHMVIYWFEGVDGIISDEFALKYNQMKNSILGRPRSTSFVRLSMMVNNHEEAGQSADKLARFAASIAPDIRLSLAQRSNWKNGSN